MKSVKVFETLIARVIAKRKRIVSLIPFLMSLVVLALAIPVQECRAGVGEFDDGEIFFELNNTDGDLGIHSLIDGDAWKKLKIINPEEVKMLDVKVKSNLKDQGLTEFFFESAEPTFDDLLPVDFFDRFEAGDYTIRGTTLEGEELENVTEVTHTMPAPPSGITLNAVPDGLPDGEPIMSERCDDEDEENFAPTEVPAPDGTVTISWAPVTTSHPDIGTPGVDLTDKIVNYQVVVEAFGVDFDSEFSVILPPDVTSMTVPAEFIALAEELFKYEILAREESFNQTAIESCFVLENGE